MIQTDDVDIPTGLYKNLDILSNEVYSVSLQMKTLESNMEAINKLMTWQKLRINSDTEALTRYGGIIPGKKEERPANSERPETPGRKKDYLEAASSTGELAESHLNLLKAMDKLPASMEGVKTGLGALNGGLKIAAGFKKVNSEDTLDKLIGIASIINGFEGIAAVSLETGPPGWIAGLGVLAGLLVVKAIKDINKTENRPTHSFLTAAEKRGNAFVLDSGRLEHDANYYIRMAENKKKYSTQSFANEMDDIKKYALSRGGNIRFDVGKAVTEPTYLPTILKLLNNDDGKGDKLIKNLAFDSDSDMAAFKNRYDKFGRFPLSVSKAVSENLLLENFYSGPELFGPHGGGLVTRKSVAPKEVPNFKKISDGVLQTMTASYMANGLPYVRKEYEDLRKKNPNMSVRIDNAWREFSAVKEQIDVGKVRTKRGYSGKSVDADYSQVEKSTIINLNKPLIGNFTIYVKDAKDGATELKHKVEEVLLEILNSANIAQ